jgi:hypothetical protein
MSDWVTLRDTLGLTLRPSDVWPGKPTVSREAGPFSAPLKDTLAVLKRELSALSAKQIVLQVAFRESDLRLDGLPRAGAIAMHPGVMLAFDSRHGSLRLFFDGFTKWQSNLRAIAMHLEHLRRAGLYGVGRDGQQYAGWTALPAPNAPPGVDPRRWAARIVAACAGGGPSMVEAILERHDARDYYYRMAARHVHPDQGGDHERFVQLQHAMELLRMPKHS